MAPTENAFVRTWQPRMLGLLRIVTGFLFIQHGSQKLFNFPPSDHPMQFPLMSQMGIAGIIEFVGGALLILGLLTRPAAFIMAGEMAVAYFMQHAPKGFWPLANKGELAVFYCFLFLYFTFAGAGAWSIDALFVKHTEEPPEADLAPGVNPQFRPH